MPVPPLVALTFSGKLEEARPPGNRQDLVVACDRMWPLAMSWPTKLLVTFAPWSKHGVGGYGHASLVIIGHPSGDSSRIGIYPNESTEWPSLSGMTFKDFQGKSTLWVSEPSPLTPGKLTPGFLSVENVPRWGYNPQDKNIREHYPTWSNMQSPFHQGSLVNWYFMCDFAKWIEMQTKRGFSHPAV